jgi:uncharacterized protein (UPF0264 family)
MTDRVKGFTVTLEHDIRIDDVEVIKQAIEMIRGVANVDCSISNIDDTINQARIKHELKQKLWEALK